MIRTVVRRRPVSLGLAALTVLLAIVTRSLPFGPSRQLTAAVGLDVDGLFLHGRVHTLLTSMLFTNGLGELIVVVALLLLVVGRCEQLIGPGRTAVAWLVTGVFGGLAGSALQAAGLLARGVWTTPPINLLVLQPVTPIAGTILAASAFAGPLWRRRIRLIGITALIVVLLYSGQPGDLDRLLAAIGGMALGGLMSRSRPRFEWVRSSHHEARTLLASLVAVAAIGPAVAVFVPRGYGLLRPLGRLFRDDLPPASHAGRLCEGLLDTAACDREVLLARFNGPGAVALSVLPLVVLLIAAVGIWYGRRIGAWTAVGVNLLLGFFAAVYFGFLPAIGDPGEVTRVQDQPTVQSALAVLVPVAIAVAVHLGRRHCLVLPTRRSLVVAGGALAAVFAALVLFYVGIGTALRGQFSPQPAPEDLLWGVPERFVPVGFLRYRRFDFAPVGPAARLLDGWIGPIGWLAVLTAVLLVTISVRRRATGQETARVRELLQLGGAGSISYMATWEGNRYFFASSGRNAIAYRDGAGVALALGEPFGDPAGAGEAAREFALRCDDQGLIPAFWNVGEEFAASLAGSGAEWAALGIGDDTVLNPATFTTKGKHWQDVRSSINRADRLGVHTVWTEWESLTLGQRSQIEAISEEWVADKRLPELGFTLGGLDELMDRDVKLMLAVGPDDRIEAVTSWLPTWRDGDLTGLTLDWMRRRPDSMNGVVEFVIAAVLAAAQQRGLRFVSLSVAPLASTGGTGGLDRLLEFLGRMLEPAYGFRSLAAFKDKFKPVVVPQLLVYPDNVALPAIAVAVARAYTPDLSVPAMARLVGALRAE